MKKTLIYLILATAVISIAYQGYRTYEAKQSRVEQQQKQASQGGLEVGMKAPNLSLRQEGKTIDLDEINHDVFVINFWATWCPPCKQEIPELNAFARHTDVPVYGINVTTSERRVSDVADFLKKTPVEYPVLYDREGTSEDAYRLVAMPATYVLDRKGTILAKHVGPVTEQMLKEMVKRTGG
ncbi:TlpA family protein disulfide reductase [Exiguobacterium acetylicum]|uniref:TlpA family protein disulfide reductase n=1 Tax=Exiguobacterium acetylicum TaxID=41170 RepID=UPI001EE20B4A|nr:TlpA disulfide reductase family protein [Exiguobacterium acetylicum]UKS56640.1 TlpA family protein disulfide reductase [Exiguobacterium acetylicum]